MAHMVTVPVLVAVAEGEGEAVSLPCCCCCCCGPPREGEERVVGVPLLSPVTEGVVVGQEEREGGEVEVGVKVAAPGGGEGVVDTVREGMGVEE